MKSFVAGVALVVLLANLASLPCVAQVDVTHALNENGLTSLVFNGRMILGSEGSGGIRPVNGTPRIRLSDGSILIPEDKPRSALDGQIVRHEFSWGVIHTRYTRDGNILRLDLRVTNTLERDTLVALELELLQLAFAQTPRARSLEAGMFGKGGTWLAVRGTPLEARPDQVAPVILLQFEDGAVAFTKDGAPDAASAATIRIAPIVSRSSSTCAFRVSFQPLPPGASASVSLSLRFGGPDADVQLLAGDVLQRFRDVYPATIKWNDRRPIGALVLATSGSHQEKNPRGWVINSPGSIDTTTPEGLRRWRERLMKYADTSIEILKHLAPETELAANGALGALDEYFRKFRDAGFRTGIALRPQIIDFTAQGPIQRYAADPLHELVERVAYAKKRWGCTLFYIDSTYDDRGALSAEIFKIVAALNPDVLLLPENETLRYFAYAAPLNSFTHHGVTSTPPSVREVYPQAFSALLATTSGEAMRQGRRALVEAVRGGDILIINAWYPGQHIEDARAIYKEAGSSHYGNGIEGPR